MKKILGLILSTVLIFTLAACQDTEPNEITFNVTNGYEITHDINSDSLDLSGITVKNTKGDDLTDLIVISGDYDLNKHGTYEVILTVTDTDSTTKSLSIYVNVSGVDCTVTPDDVACLIDVTGIELTNDSIPDELFIDEFFRFKWEITPLEASNQNVTITTSYETVITVSNTGFAFAEAPGTATVTITSVDGGYSVSHTFTVLEPTCEQDPTQDKCFSDILLDDSRIITVQAPNQSGTDYNEVYVNHNLYYEIFVRKYADSDDDYIGDFNGIKDNLEYLSNLGVEGIWLMPINESSSSHGYDVNDYFSVNSDYGTMTEFQALVAEAHTYGIDIIIDLVLNHMGAHNDIFQDVLKYGTHSDYYDWFIWANSNDYRDPANNDIWRKPNTWLVKNNSFSIHSTLSDKWFYGLFSDWMPDFNLENPEVVAYINSIADFWLEDIGIDGFRLDATSHFYHNDEYSIPNAHQKNIEFLTNFRNHCETVNPDVYIVGEAWESYQTYGEFYSSGNSFFNFQGSYWIKDRVRNYNSDIGNTMNTLYDYFDNYDPDFIDAIFVGNHDMTRVAEQVGESRLSMVAEIQLTLPGNPFIYYGDELGMVGSNSYGEARTRMVWGDYYGTSRWTKEYADRDVATVTEQLADDNSLLNTYMELGIVRKNSLALKYGGFVPYNTTGLEGYYRVFENGNDKELVLVLFNFSSTTVRAIPSEITSYEILYSSQEGNIGGISARSSMIIRIPYELKDDLIN